ncbi:hypothetical protein D3C72_1009060 [compost metagenome]
MRLKPLAVAGNGLDPDGKTVSRGLLDPLRNFSAAAGHVGNAGKTGAEDELIIAAAQAMDPLRPLFRRQAVDDGDRYRQILLQSAEHDRLCRHVSFGKEDAERQAVGDGETGKQDEEKSGPQRARPPAGEQARAVHILGSEISTGTAKT